MPFTKHITNMHAKTAVHSFHIPVMGLAFTIDSPIKVAQYGINSVVSIVDDVLIEKINEFYSHKYKLPFQSFPTKQLDSRAQRITSYLNNMDTIVKQKFENFTTALSEKKEMLWNYLDMLPDYSELKRNLVGLVESNTPKKEIAKWLKKNIAPGAIDVNIMTKLDNENYHKKTLLGKEYNDAHAALRGFAKSNLHASIVLSAGMNPHLYSYFEKFEDFYPLKNGFLKKKVILKVSDYRSAMIQGLFFAKKGIWVSEYRVESGLNCGGHAFATEGLLLGPILETFTQNKETLIQQTFEIYSKALSEKGKHCPTKPLPLAITVQGGVGTSEEHEFLINQYHVDSVGWGSPFLLVPEATTVDSKTNTLLQNATEEDLYLSTISPLGVPFNSVKGNSYELLKNNRSKENKIGSSCPKKFLAFDKQYTEQSICTASQKFQKIKIKKLNAMEMDETTYEKRFQDIVKKSCLCVGLSNAALLEKKINSKETNQGVLVCPGPNIAYFDKKVSLKKMIQHIYGKTTIIRQQNRPHMFVKELEMYVKYFQEKIIDFSKNPTKKSEKKTITFHKNLMEGILYYENLFKNSNPKILSQFSHFKSKLEKFL